MSFGVWFDRESLDSGGSSERSIPSPKPEDLSYPVTQKWLKRLEGSWSRISMYGITGWWVSDYDCGPFTGQAVAFGGYLKLVEEIGDFMGSILDPIGYAKIEGFLSEDGLTFVKTYQGGIQGITSSVPITYIFKKNDDGFEGNFRLQYDEGDFLGRAFCKLQLVVTEACGVIHELSETEPPNPHNN